jgi:hypothetical protein
MVWDVLKMMDECSQYLCPCLSIIKKICNNRKAGQIR